MGTILQLEMMLKAWFPQVRPQHRDGTPSFQNFMTSLPPRWNQDQLHIPVKVSGKKCFETKQTTSFST